jgi:hypothetical protein
MNLTYSEIIDTLILGWLVVWAILDRCNVYLRKE